MLFFMLNEGARRRMDYAFRFPGCAGAVKNIDWMTGGEEFVFFGGIVVLGPKAGQRSFWVILTCLPFRKEIAV